MVQVPRAVRNAVYRHIFKYNGLSLEETIRTQDIAEITYQDENGRDIHPRNLYVNMIMKSLKSRGYVRDTFAWKHHYYVLTKDGEAFIRRELDIDDVVRPDPCSKQIAEKPQEERRDRAGFRRGDRRGDRAERPAPRRE